MEERDLIRIIEHALSKNKAIKDFCRYQGNRALQIMAQDGTVFNILPVNATGKALNLCGKAKQN